MIESTKEQCDKFPTDKEIIKVVKQSLIAAAGSLMLSKPETNKGNYQDQTKPLAKNLEYYTTISRQSADYSVIGTIN